MSQPAVFLDRDETIIEDPGFIRDPARVRLRAGAAEAIRRFRAAGYKVVVVSNQSGVARGLITEEQLAAVHGRLEELIEQEGASLDGIYYCPYLDGPEAVVEAYRKESELRKPSPGMLLKAARELGLDLSCSWMIGDRAADVEAGQRAGCRTIRLEQTQRGAAGPQQWPSRSRLGETFRAETLLEAARIVEEHTSNHSAPPGERTGRSGPEVVRLLEQIRDLLDRRQRLESRDDFSFLRLFGTLCQMLAIVLALWGLFALFEVSTANSATARFVLAVFFQLVTMTILLAERRP